MQYIQFYYPGSIVSDSLYEVKWTKLAHTYIIKIEVSYINFHHYLLNKKI